MSSREDFENYWSSYYASEDVPQLPSQFAVLVANELRNGDLPSVGSVFDIGCGNGRDAFYFLNLGYSVRGVDASEEAISVCCRRRDGTRLADGVTGDFFAGPADLPVSWLRLREGVDGPILVYARFFFHAITEAAQDAILKQVAALLREQGGALCAEFRTPDDRARAKQTSEHYRRYIELSEFADSLKAVGLNPIWQAEGRGMAKYRKDDATVARVFALP